LDLEKTLFEDILPRVQKPSRYLGGELNAVRKSARPGDVRVALAFPDLYDVGLSNLGVLILYRMLNDLPGVVAERTYAPGVDLEALLRERDLPLFSWETKTPLAEFDAIGFSLQYELSAVNVLTMLDLAGVPLRAEARDDRHPLILAGGPCAYHPEPYAPFIDAFAIGDGEPVIASLVECVRETRGRPREERLRALAEIRGVYVPLLQPLVRGPGGEILPAPDAPRVRRSLLPDLDDAPFPTDMIVPFTEQVHDRVSLEVLRGCTHGCRFCQAGMTYRPVRERGVARLVELADETISRTGYDEVSLSSLSTCDHSRVRQLVAQALGQLAPRGVSIALSSLRIDSFSIELAEMVAAAKRSGLTFAPEAATPRLRALINKWIPDEALLATTTAVLERGWNRVKLYFMIGLPTETDDDVEAIANLSREVLRRGREVQPRAQVSVSVATFVPKPHTPFQWEGQISLAETRRRQGILKNLLRGGRIQLRPHEPGLSWLEGIISRGDRRVGELIELAWREGCRLDAWSEHFDLAKWQAAIEKWGLAPESFLAERDPSAPLPWDHVDALVTKEFLRGELEKAKSREGEEALTSDCRMGCHDCGVLREGDAACREMIRTWASGHEESENWRPGPPPRTIWGEPDAMRIRFRFTKERRIALLSHLELQSALARTLRRAGIPVAYTQGFSPHMKLALGDALPVGMSSEGEYADVRLRAPLDPALFAARVNAACPRGVHITGATQAVLTAPSLTSRTAAASYRVGLRRLGVERADLEAKLQAFRARSEFVIERIVKKGGRRKTTTIDVRALVHSAAVREIDGEIVLEAMIGRREGNLGRPRELLIALLALDAERLLLAPAHKLDAFVQFDGRLVSIGQGWAVPGRFDPYAEVSS
jgi:radical SAM family uncharacterized protein/radical SAM-linked protein